MAFDSSYIINGTAQIVLASDTTQPPTTTVTAPGKWLPGNRVSVDSHTGTTVILNQAPHSSLDVRVFFRVSVPVDIGLPTDYIEDPEFSNDGSLEYLDALYVNQNQDETVYGEKTWNDQAIFSDGVRISTGAASDSVLVGDSSGNATWETQDTFIKNNLGTAGVLDGYVLHADGSGGFEWRPDIQQIGNRYSVGNTLEADYRSIKSAVDDANLVATAENPYLVEIYPGEYNEDPMTVGPGIFINSIDSFNTAKVIANNPDEHLFSFDTIGGITALEISGITNTSKTAVNLSTNGRFQIVNLNIRNCSNGIILDGGGFASINNCAISIDDATKRIENGISIDNASTAIINQL